MFIYLFTWKIYLRSKRGARLCLPPQEVSGLCPAGYDALPLLQITRERVAVCPVSVW